MRDLEEHPLEIEGTWIRICCKLWWAEPKGKLTRTLEQWAKILRINTEQAGRVLRYVFDQRIGDISLNGGNAKIAPEIVTDIFSNASNNAEITIISRRMYNDNKDRGLNMLRQRRFKDKKKSNAEITEEKRISNDNVTPPSSSSSSTSTSTSKRKNILSDEEWVSKIKSLYPWVNWEDVNREMDAWLMNNPGRQKTRRFITNWLLRKQKDKPLETRFARPNLPEDPVEKRIQLLKEIHAERNKDGHS